MPQLARVDIEQFTKNSAVFVLGKDSAIVDHVEQLLAAAGSTVAKKIQVAAGLAAEKLAELAVMA